MGEGLSASKPAETKEPVGERRDGFQTGTTRLCVWRQPPYIFILCLFIYCFVKPTLFEVLLF